MHRANVKFGTLWPPILYNIKMCVSLCKMFPWRERETLFQKKIEFGKAKEAVFGSRAIFLYIVFSFYFHTKFIFHKTWMSVSVCVSMSIFHDSFGQNNQDHTFLLLVSIFLFWLTTHTHTGQWNMSKILKSLTSQAKWDTETDKQRPRKA